ncbi:Endoglucanase-4 [Lachnellula arida]|uniref:Endoglucanase-4 n=1 Tax=Lachnellula arida TaxID=1316785 RepID=A0A8T9B8P5_9HELO|nr:Endoglucanase-4 [Lachnellula arida]
MSFSKISAITGALAFVSRVAAHGTVTGIVADGVYYEGYHASNQYLAVQPVVVGWSTPEDQSNGFIDPNNYTTSEIICHLGATNAQTSATVAAGGSVELQWSAWPSSHHGPVIDYLANCNGDCKTVDKTTLEFFKIDGVGLVSDTTIPGDWATDTLIANNNSWTVSIPTDIAPGNYVLRHEIIALHSAGEADGAQNYPQCVNLEVTGSGTATPSGTLGTSLYTPSDAGISINIYQSLSTYVVPGPTLYSGAISASQTAAASATAVSSSSAGAVTSSVSVAASSSAAGAAKVVSSPSSGITSKPVASGARYPNGTATASKSKSACKSKSKASGAVSISSRAPVAAVATSSIVATSSDVSTTFADSVTIATTSSVPTSASVPAASPSAQASSGSPSSPTSSDATAPEGTTLNNLLSWVSSFYSTHKDTEYNGNTVARRAHARDIVRRQEADKFPGSSVNILPTGGFPRGTGAGSAQPTGLPGRIVEFAAKGTGAPHHSHGTKPTGVLPRAEFAQGTGAPHHSHGTKPTGVLRRAEPQESGRPQFSEGSGFPKPTGGAQFAHPQNKGVAKPSGAIPKGGAFPRSPRIAAPRA